MEEKDSCCILDRYKAVSRSVDLVKHYDSMNKDIFDTNTFAFTILVVKDSMIYF